MVRSGIELELLAQAKIDDYYTHRDLSFTASEPSNPTFFTTVRRRFGLRLIAAGTRLAGPDLPATTRPAVAGQP
jgi:hypothetical protein